MKVDRPVDDPVRRYVTEVAENELYAVCHKKVWVPAFYRGYDANFIRKRNQKRFGGYIFTGIGSGTGIVVETLDDVQVRDLPQDTRQRLIELDREYWRGLHAHIDHIKQWLDEQRRIEAAAEALCRQRGRLILIKSCVMKDGLNQCEGD